jgi:hypothetical protein
VNTGKTKGSSYLPAFCLSYIGTWTIAATLHSTCATPTTKAADGLIANRLLPVGKSSSLSRRPPILVDQIGNKRTGGLLENTAACSNICHCRCSLMCTYFRICSGCSLSMEEECTGSQIVKSSHKTPAASGDPVSLAPALHLLMLP